MSKKLTQRERIARAHGAYIVPTNTARSRFQVYLLGDKGLELLCPNTEDKKDKLHYQRVQTSDPSKPRSCFALGGGGYSKTDSIARVLREYNSDLQIEVLKIGFFVDSIRAKPSARYMDESDMYSSEEYRNRDKFRKYSVIDHDGAEMSISRGDDGKFSMTWSVIDLPDNADARIGSARSWEDAERIANKLVGQSMQMNAGPAGSLKP